MKRIFASLLLAAVLLVSTAASASSVDLTAMTNDELNVLANEIVAELANRYATTATRVGPYTVEIKDAELMKDDDGNDCLVVTFAWSHQKDEPQTFYWSFNFYAYQDGIQISEPDVYISMPKDTQDTRIKAGAMLETQIAFVVGNTVSPVEVEITEYLGETDDKAEKAFDLNALGGGQTTRPTGGNSTGGNSTGGLTVIGKPTR